MQNKSTGIASVKYLTITGIMSAISSVLMLWEFPIAFMFPTFLKFDFSDLPALITAFLLGPIYGVAVELVKNIVNLFTTTTGGVGQLANFVIGATFVYCAGAIYKHNRTRKAALMGMLAGTVAMSIVGAFTNYFIMIPLYSKFMPLETIIEMCSVLFPVKSLLGAIIFVFTPFNLLKGSVISFITFVIYKRISVILKLNVK